MDYEQRLVKRMYERAAEHPRWGTGPSRRCWSVRAGRSTSSESAVSGAWREIEFPGCIPKAPAKRAEGIRTNDVWKLRAKHPDHVWGMDIMCETTGRGRRFRIFNVVDEFTRVALACRVDTTIGTRAVMEELESLFQTNGKPKTIRSDNGREFIAATLKNWLAERGVAIAHIEKGQPQQNCFVERYNGPMRNEVLANEDSTQCSRLE